MRAMVDWAEAASVEMKLSSPSLFSGITGPDGRYIKTGDEGVEAWNML